MTDHAAKLRGLDRFDLYGSDWDILTSAADRIVYLEDLLGRFAALVKEDCGSIPSLGEWGDPDDDYIVELAERAALKPKL
jgi:hypothetical protein